MARCSLCKCDTTRAWPRVFLLNEDVCNDNEFFSFTEAKILSAIDAGCHACAFLKRGIELFHSLESLEPFQTLRRKYGHFVNHRLEDNAWLVTLKTGKDSLLILEFVEGDRKLIYPTLPTLTKLSKKQ
jgi:hypothetical protein